MNIVIFTTKIRLINTIIKNTMSKKRTYFDDTTVALGTIYTLICLATIAAILIWG